jgi:PBP1b-binding outer membrane lipoprotein LpoB
MKKLLSLAAAILLLASCSKTVEDLKVHNDTESLKILPVNQGASNDSDAGVIIDPNGKPYPVNNSGTSLDPSGKPFQNNIGIKIDGNEKAFN